MFNNLHIIDVTIDNIEETGIFCVKDKKSEGSKHKVEWFKVQFDNGLKIKIVADGKGKHLGFIEYIPSELAWRPIIAKNYYFIHCIVIFSNNVKNNGVGTFLLKCCELDAKTSNKSGVCVMTSDGVWMANKNLFLKNGYIISEELTRFELLYKQFDKNSAIPKLFDWTKEQNKYQGWNLIYAEQCPWHIKSVKVLHEFALSQGININVIKLSEPKDAQKAPSGFGTFSLIKDGKLLADHYISKTRFENILKKEI